MKKFAIVITLVVFIFTGLAQAQSSKVVSAYNYHRKGVLDKAKDNIDAASTHEKTAMDAKTWYYRGNIYIDIYRSDNEDYKKLDPDALNKAYEAYNKALELDEKERYVEDVKRYMPIVAEAYFNQGANKYNAGMEANNNGDTTLAKDEFRVSMDSFLKANKIYEESGVHDTTAVYYISIAAEMAKVYDIAREKLQYLIGVNYEEPGIYTSLASIYYNHDKDVSKALKTYELGRERYPEDLNMLLNQTNVFLSEEMTEEALNNLQMAAEIDTTNPTIFFAIGAKYNELVDDTTKSDEMRKDAFVKAVDAYDKAVQLKPDYFDPAYNMGALYVNKASSLIDYANQLPLDAVDEYDALKAEADGYLEKCLPYLEKALEIQPNDQSTMYSLKEIYTRLNMPDKLKEINAKISALSQ